MSAAAAGIQSRPPRLFASSLVPAPWVRAPGRPCETQIIVAPELHIRAPAPAPLPRLLLCNPDPPNLPCFVGPLCGRRAPRTPAAPRNPNRRRFRITDLNFVTHYGSVTILSFMLRTWRTAR